jgi:enediyne biosynthesis protein E4
LFTNQSLETALGALTAGSSACGLEDLDNDGWKDLLVTQSHVLDNVEAIDRSLHYLETPLLALNHNGRFERTESGVTTPVAGRGLAFGDLNNDGWLDAVVTVLGGHPLILMNRGGKRHWRSITLRGTRSTATDLGRECA